MSHFMHKLKFFLPFAFKMIKNRRLAGQRLDEDGSNFQLDNNWWTTKRRSSVHGLNEDKQAAKWEHKASTFSRSSHCFSPLNDFVFFLWLLQSLLLLDIVYWKIVESADFRCYYRDHREVEKSFEREMKEIWTKLWLVVKKRFIVTTSWSFLLLF